MGQAKGRGSHADRIQQARNRLSAAADRQLAGVSHMVFIIERNEDSRGIERLVLTQFPNSQTHFRAWRNGHKKFALVCIDATQDQMSLDEVGSFELLMSGALANFIVHCVPAMADMKFVSGLSDKAASKKVETAAFKILGLMRARAVAKDHERIHQAPGACHADVIAHDTMAYAKARIGISKTEAEMYYGIARLIRQSPTYRLPNDGGWLETFRGVSAHDLGAHLDTRGPAFSIEFDCNDVDINADRHMARSAVARRFALVVDMRSKVVRNEFNLGHFVDFKCSKNDNNWCLILPFDYYPQFLMKETGLDIDWSLGASAMALRLDGPVGVQTVQEADGSLNHGVGPCQVFATSSLGIAHRHALEDQGRDANAELISDVMTEAVSALLWLGASPEEYSESALERQGADFFEVVMTKRRGVSH